MARKLYLYTTLGCSLCEKAKLEIWPQLEQFRLQLQEVDIAEDPELLEHFATQIPVVGLGDPRDVCIWPFDRAQLNDWLRQRI
ncbi:glutaredoxin family protein [Microbulbifer magnicolonia]|uniref:glutaredoxin family protein n=1 Tax=Microbulbifer magnicolonia TaxID=3109744 RepID=UPI002B413169|nr:glutaredoxin family protein [Microbulbifer sp. GG15]